MVSIAFDQDLSYALFSYLDSYECWTLEQSINPSSINLRLPAIRLIYHFETPATSLTRRKLEKKALAAAAEMSQLLDGYVPPPSSAVLLSK